MDAAKSATALIVCLTFFTATASPQQQKSTPLAASTAGPSREKYQLVVPSAFGIMAQISVTEMTQVSNCTGDIKGKIDFIYAAGKPLELQTHNIVHEDNKAWIVTKKYGKIRVSGGYEGDHPPSGLCWWLTPSQKAQLKALSDAK